MRLSPYYINSNVKKGKVQLVDIPTGTIFFRSIELKDPRYIFRDFLGRPQADGNYCMSATQNVFTFHLPKASFGLYDWTSEKPAWHKYNGYMVYTLAQTRPFINMISPSTDTRPTPKGNKAPDAAIRRCDTYELPCAGNSLKAKEFFSFDNCVNPEFMKKTGTMGYIAIAGDDSLDANRKIIGDQIIKSPLGSYLSLLEPNAAADLLLQLYVDNNKHRGFPEIAFYSRKTPLINPIRKIETFDEALQTFSDELMNNEYTILPVALITAEGIHYFLDLDENSYLNISTTIDNPEDRRRSMEANLDKFTEKAKRVGIEGYGTMDFDLRTGFFIFEDLAPTSYKKYLAPLKSEREEKQVDVYIAANKRMRNPSDFSKKMKIDGKYFLQSFIFERPSNLTEIFNKLNIKPTSELFKRLLTFDGKRSSKSERKSNRKTQKIGLSKRFIGGLRNTRKLIKKLKFTENSIEAIPQMPAIHSITPSAPSPLGGDIVNALQSMRRGIIQNSIKHFLTNIKTK